MTSTPLRIVGLGDSTTAGTPGFLSPLEAPPSGDGNPESQYAFWMMKQHPEWTVLNRGINGQRSDEIRIRFPQEVISQQPRYVIIIAGVNDIYQHAPIERLQENLLSMYRESVNNGIRPVAASILPYNSTTIQETETMRTVNEWIHDTAGRLEIPFCDTHRAVADPNNGNKLSSSPDGLHPDVKGYRAMGEVLALTIERDLTRN